MTDWRQLADRYGKTVEEVKAELPLEWVISVAAGIQLTSTGEGRSVGLCPFHTDQDPSLDVYGYGERWGCYPCGDGGDVYDFIGKYWDHPGFGARFEKALELLTRYVSEGDESWKKTITAAAPSKPVTVEELGLEYKAALDNVARTTTQPVARILERKGGHLARVNADWLLRTWRLGVTSNGEIMAPYFNRDGEIVSLKTRNPERGGWFTRKGTRLTSLYGEWQLIGPAAEADVWLCEGETDTWMASWLLRGRGIALGLPAGAGSRITEEWVELMRDRRVVLVMDADRAGRAAAERWWTQLVGICREVLVTFPESDLAESRDPLRVLEAGKVVPSQSGFIVPRSDGRAYQALGANGPGEVVSNFVFHPTKHITYLDSHGQPSMPGYEGRFADETSHLVRVTTADFQSSSSLGNWANINGRAWYGANRKHVQSLLDQLQAQEPFLKEETAVPVVGLWGEDTAYPVFVLPDEAGGVIGSEVGKERWSYSERLSKVEVGSKYRLFHRDDSKAEIEKLVGALLQVNHPRITTPLISWLAIAPLRKLFAEFPPMAVLGDSGSGKTAMTGAMVQAFYGWQGAERNLTNTTPYAVKAESAGVNGLPVWWDEYRRGARADTFATVGQVIRDSWTGSVSSRGGMGEDLSRVEQTAAIAPLLLSGEESLEERSHIDRVVVIGLTKGGHMDSRNEENLGRVLELVGAGFGGVIGRQLIEFHLRHLAVGDLGAVPAVRDRQEQGLSVLRMGWNLWKAWLEEDFGLRLKWDLDLSNVGEQREGVGENPEIDALLEAISMGARERGDDPVPVAWVEAERMGNGMTVTAFRSRALYKWAVSRGYALPGGERAMKNLLMSRYPVLTRDKADYFVPGLGEGGRRRVQAIRIVGVIEAETDRIREGEISDLERNLGKAD